VASTLEAAFAALARGFADVDDALHRPGGAARLLGALGFDLPPGMTDIGLGAIDFSAVVDGLGALTDARVSGTSVQIGGAYAGLAVAMPELVDRLRTVAGGFAAPADYLARTGIVAEFFPRLTELVVIRTVASIVPTGLAIGTLTGVFVLQPVEPDPAAFRPRHIRHIVRWDRLTLLLSDPVRLLREVFGWGSPAFAADGLTLAVGGLLELSGSTPRIRPLPARVEARLAGAVVPEAAVDPRLQLFVSLLRGLAADPLDVGLSAYALRPTVPGGADGGIGFSPYVLGGTGAHFPVSDDVALDIEGIAEVLAGLAVLIRPGVVAIKGGVTGGGPLTTPSAPVSLTLTATPAGKEPSTLLAIPGGTRVEYTAVTLTVGIRPGEGAAAQPYVEIGLTGARFILDVSAAGGLVRALLPADAVRADLDLAIGWSAGRAYLRGSADLRASFAVHRSLGPVELQALHVGLTPGSGGLPIEVSATVGAALGPLEVTIERIGLRATLDFPAGGGNLGPARLELGFQPPAGLGVDLDAGLVQGGGYLSVDPSGGRYAGVLNFRLSFIGVTAYGIYEQAPGGAPSFVAVLGIRFWPGIQLGFGFALTGVGGMVGLNRRANVDLLRERLAGGAAGNVLFCDDPVKNAPTLLGDLAAFFPPAAGTFVVGPTLQLGWMSPIVRIDVAVLIELPGPSKIVILGSIRVLIGADETLALLYLRMDFLGVLDFEQRMISLDAVLVNSHALGVFRLTGGMALRLSYGDNPYILLSIGGFHPRFDPGPLNLPAIPRVGAVLDVSVVARVYLRLELYVAFTSNTLQLGAKVEAGLELGPISASGYLTFDALIQFRPFAFDIDFSAGFSVEVFDVSLCSVDVAGRLTGPGPLVVHAEATVQLLFIEVSGSATIELGGNDGDKPQAIPSIVKALESELGRDANLRAEGADHQIVPRPDQPVAGVLVSPLGSLIWEQKRAPLETLVDRFEGAPLVGWHQLQLEVPAGWTVRDETDWFSPGTFTSLDLKASQTLNNATFQQLRSGVRIGSTGDALAPTAVPYTPKIDIMKRPTPSGWVKLVDVPGGSYLTGPLTGALDERDSTPPVRPGPAKVVVGPETFDVTAADGDAVAVAETPFQAFQLSRRDTGRLATPNADVVVTL
jgi:hypothetical protein